MLSTITIPATDLTVSRICYGSGAIATGDAMERLYVQFREVGGNFFDTAHCYCFWLKDGMGASERALGNMLRRHYTRDAVVIASKGGHPAVGAAYPRPDRYLAPEVIAADLDDSLQRLGFDHIDLYYLHRDDAREPVGEIIEMLNAEIRRGRIRYFGASNWRTERIAAANAYAAAHGLHGFVASQPQWNFAQANLPADAPDPAMRPLAPRDVAWHTASQLPVIPYSSTACGYFAGNTRPSTLEQFDNPVSQQRRARAEQLAAELGCSANQLALAYLLHQPFPVIPIIGTANPAHLADALAATSITLTREQVEWLAGE